jgi:NAD+ diphosphatase
MQKNKNIKDAYWIVIYKELVLCPKDQAKPLEGDWKDLHHLHAFEDDMMYMGDFNQKRCYMIDVGSQSMCEDTFTALSLRAFLMQSPPELFSIVSRAWQVALFLRTHRYCGQCGHEMTRVDWELATHCHSCGHRCYPRISPCIIVAIKHQDKILLAQGRHHKLQMYSTLAGFVESGETLEEAVHREVFEEVGVRVKNLRYFGSQPWPFPHSLMCGFLADYKEGEIKIDEHEILDAKWFSFDDMPNIPPTFSIAGQLIEATREEVTGT